MPSQQSDRAALKSDRWEEWRQGETDQRQGLPPLPPEKPAPAGAETEQCKEQKTSRHDRNCASSMLVGWVCRQLIFQFKIQSMAKRPEQARGDPGGPFPFIAGDFG